ncbi:MAG: CocE/NonD family hydrolase [Pseudomonadota bacterium]
MDEPKRISKTKTFGGQEMEVILRMTRRPLPVETRTNKAEGDENWDGLEEKSLAGAGFGFCPPLNPRTYEAAEGIICEQDVAVTLRDGSVIYADIYRPKGQTKIPAIISWSYFGKRPGDGFDEWQIIGVPPGTVSRMAKFESPDPGFWCHQGYAVANVDPRGIGNSQGDVDMFGTQDGRDGHDFIEWLAVQPWCSGRVAMGGNSGVAMTQWRIAAEQPPHLTCIAPWEGTGDLYRESLYEGGIPALSFNNFIVGSLVGQGYVDDTAAMAEAHPFLDAYWADKIPRWKDIRIPVYTTVCWNHFHLRGSMEGFRRIRSRKKWLRAHREFEWPDTYSPFGIDDLKRFYDRYLKEIHNGWELTPRIRLEVMDAYEFDYATNRPEKEFPLARTEYRKLYIDAGKGALCADPVAGESKTDYDPETGQASFTMAFDETTEITGFMKLRLWVEAEGHDDMDLFVSVRKLDAGGNWLPVHVLGEDHPGAWGKMRVSRRELDEKLSTHFQPIQAHQRDQKLSPGEIVPVDIEIWPHSRIWHKGQQLEVVVSGRYIREGWFEPLSWDTNNTGRHVIHSGGQYDAYLQIPVIPPRYKAGNTVY